MPTNEPKTSVSVQNAGMVLLNGYFPILFERLGLMESHQFIGQNQGTAALYLQYLTTGLSHTEEHFLPLNKILCGMELSTPIETFLDISPENKELIDGLMTAAIDYWSTIGSSSIEGFRGNWLVRDGILTESEDQFELTVEKRPYDLLLAKAPFSYSIINYPWMEKPLHVTWNY